MDVRSSKICTKQPLVLVWSRGHVDDNLGGQDNGHLGSDVGGNLGSHVGGDFGDYLRKL